MARKLPDGMRTRPGRRGYYADFAVAGRRRRDYLGTDYQAACEILAELKANAFRGKFSLDPAALDGEDVSAWGRAILLDAAKRKLAKGGKKGSARKGSAGT
jgi:hypothetical protein